LGLFGWLMAAFRRLEQPQICFRVVQDNRHNKVFLVVEVGDQGSH